MNMAYIRIEGNCDGSYAIESSGSWHEVRGLIEAAELEWRCRYIASNNARYEKEKIARAEAEGKE
jgi:hypothetical protein